jgi:hypothetical protein
MGHNYRKVQRFAVQLPCTLGNLDHHVNGTVLNLSVQGCAITAEHVPAVSTYVSLEIDLLNREARAAIELAAVRWVSGNRCGLEFIRVTPDILVRLNAFVLLLEQTP